MNSSALDCVTVSSSLAENKEAYCTARLFGSWGGGGPFRAPDDVLCVSQKLLCLVPEFQRESTKY